MKRTLIVISLVTFVATSISLLHLDAVGKGVATYQTRSAPGSPFRANDIASTRAVERRKRSLKIAHDLILKSGHGLNPDFFGLSLAERSTWLAAHRSSLPEMATVQKLKKPLAGVNLASTLYLPETNELADDTVIVVDNLVFSGHAASMKGNHNIFIYARLVQVGDSSNGKTSLRIDVSGEGTQKRELHTTPAEIARTVNGSKFFPPGLASLQLTAKTSYLKNSPSNLFVAASLLVGGENGDNGSDGENGSDGQAGSCTTGPSGNGNNGAAGTAGNSANIGEPGGDGSDASSANIGWYICGNPMDLYVTARGAAGSQGGPGGNGGKGGKGGNGGKGGDGTGVNAGNGGNGGSGADGGAGGDGGFGGNGGDGGDIIVYTDWCSWSEGSINIDNSGGAGGQGGNGGNAGEGGGAGGRGEGGSALTSPECPNLGSNGSPGTGGNGGTSGTAGFTGFEGWTGSDGFWAIYCDGC